MDTASATTTSSSPTRNIPNTDRSVMLQRMLSDNVLLSARTSMVSPSSGAAKHRSKSPTYLRNSRTGERRIRRSSEEVDELTEQKLERKSIVGSSLAHTMGESGDAPGKGSISNETSTSRTADDSFVSSCTSSNDSRESPATPSSPVKRHGTMSRNSRASRNAFILVSPNRTPMSLKKKKSGRRITLGLDHHHHASLPNIGVSDDCSSLNQTVESRGRKKSKEGSKEKKKIKKKKVSRSKSVGVTEEPKSTKSDKMKRKEERAKSIGPSTSVEKQRSRSTTSRHSDDRSKEVARTVSLSTATTVSSSESFVSHGECPVTILHMKSQSKLKDEGRSRRSPSKVRTTVDENGKIRRTKVQRGEDEDDTSRDSRKSKSVQSRSSSASRSKLLRQHSMFEEHRKRRSDTSLSTSEAVSPVSRPRLMKRQNSESSHRSDSSHNTGKSFSLKIDPIKSTDLQKEIDTLQEELLAVKAAQASGMAEVTRANRELRKTRLELQKSITERGELRLQIQEQDHLIKERELKIEILEKAIESQLDKVDELEEELRKVYEDVFALERRISDLTGLTHSNESEDEQIKSDSQRRLTELKSKKEEDLESRSLHLKQETERILNEMPKHDIHLLQKENETLRKALRKEKDDSALRLLNKNRKIHDLRNKICSNVQGGVTRTAESPCRTMSAQKDKDLVFQEMESEIKRLRKELSDRVGVSETNSFEHAKEEVKVMKAKWEGAQRRNTILEEDIDHWKSLNCSLEEELDETKAQAAMWKAKYLTAACSAGPTSTAGSGCASGVRSAADISMMRKDEETDNGGLDGSQNSIATLWSKLTKSNSVLSMNQSFHSANSREETVSKAIF